MANNFDGEFNYDSEDPELDENGLPVEDDSSIDDFIDLIQQLQEKEDEEGDDDDSHNDSSDRQKKDDSQLDDKSNKPEKGEGGGHENKVSSTDKPNITQKAQHGPSTTKPSGGNNWFSKFTSFGKGGGGAGAKAGGAVAKGAGAGAGAAGAAGGGGSGVIAGLGYAWWIILIIVVVILIIVIVISIVAYLQEKTDPDNMKSNEYINSNYFYGTRSVYIDDEILLNSLQLSYKQYVIDIVLDITTRNPGITVNISLPEMTENILNSNSETLDQNIINMSNGIANIIATGSDEYLDIDFSVLYPQIEYFGITLDQGDQISTFLINYFTSNNLIPTTGDLSLDDMIESAVAGLSYMYNRCEKVMIKDEIASNSGLENIEQRQYVASIYMPNKDIRIIDSTYTIASFYDTFSVKSSLIEENYGTTNIITEQETKDGADIIDGVESSVKTVSLKRFTSIDADNVEAFKDGVSLFHALKMNTRYKQFFTLNSETGAYSWKPTDSSLLYLTFEADKMFIFTDFDMFVNTSVA